MRKIIILVMSVIFLVGGIGSKKIIEDKIQDNEIDDVNIVDVLTDEESVEDEIIDEEKDSEEIEKTEKENNVETKKVVEEENTINNLKSNSSSNNNSKIEVKNSTSQQETKSSQNNQINEEIRTENNTQDTTQNNNTQNNIISTTFYDSITHGRREFKSEAEAIARGDSIVDNELNYVLDYNEAHTDNQIQPTINYYRIYPSVIDENGTTWYYLHFFTTNGENQDDILKSKY